MLTDANGNPINADEPESEGTSKTNGATKHSGISDVRCASLADIIYTLIYTTNRMMTMEGELMAMQHFAEQKKMVRLPEGGDQIAEAIAIMKHQLAVMTADLGRRTRHIDMDYWEEIGVIVNEDGSRSLPDQPPEVAN